MRTRYLMLLAVLAWMLALPASAATHRDPHCTWALDATVTSVHIPRDGMNEWNPGVGIECDLHNGSIGVGTYKNSFAHRTNYALAAWLPWHKDHWAFGAALGLASGYTTPERDGVAAPILGGLFVRYRPADRLGLNLLIVPPVEPGTCMMMGLQFTLTL